MVASFIVRLFGSKQMARIYYSIVSSIKSGIFNSIQDINVLVNQLKDRIDHEHEYPNPKKYLSLTPTVDIDSEGLYDEALKWAIETKDVTNIAVTGTYGSGKSSVLKKFIKEHSEFNFLKISLAAFKEDEYSFEINQDRLIEFSILQQMFYTEDGKKLKDSRFRRISYQKTWEVLTKSIFILAWICSILISFKPSLFSSNVIFSYIFSSPNLKFCSDIYLLLGATYFIMKLIWAFNKVNFSKLNLKEGQIELSGSNDQSILNKHIEEIIYLFQVTKYNCVVFEDLDRFESTEVFTKLREINILLNQSQQIKKKITFIYAIKDDKFNSSDRIKFFDFILPIVPVISTSNSGSVLLNYFNQNFIEHKISANFLEDISLFINDMRLLKNIVNEYSIYHSIISKELNQEKLLALIIYKNLFPDDFTLLCNSDGKVYNMFKFRLQELEKENKDYQSKISVLEQEIKSLDKIVLKNINELRRVYIFEFLAQFPSADKFILHGECSLEDVLSDQNFELFKNSENIQFLEGGISTIHDSGLSFSSIESMIDSINSYNARENHIKNRGENRINEIQLEMQDLKALNEIINQNPISDYNVNYTKMNELSGCKNSNVLIYFVTHKYLDDNFLDYTSLFHEGLLTETDRRFLISLRIQVPLPFNHQLKKIQNLLRKIREEEWEREEILNFSLMNYLISNNKYYDDILSKLGNKFSNSSSRYLKFIREYLDHGENPETVIPWLAIHYEHIWSLIPSSTTVEKKDQILIILFNNLNLQSLNKVNKQNRITAYLNNHENTTVLLNNTRRQTINYLVNWGVKIKKVQFVDKNNITNAIYNYNLYAINLYNISGILELYLGEWESDLETAPFTTIINSKLEHLISYVTSNMSEFYPILLSKTTLSEEEGPLKKIINNKDIPNPAKKEILYKWTLKFKTFIDLDDEYLNFILEQEAITVSWENILEFYTRKNKNLDSNLINYLNKENIFDQIQPIDTNSAIITSTSYKILLEDLLFESDLKEEAFKAIFKNIEKEFYQGKNFEYFKDLKKERIKFLIRQGFISPDILQLIKAHNEGVE